MVLLLRGLIPRKLRLEHYAGAALFGVVTSYYTFMPFLAEQARLREAGLLKPGESAPASAHPGLAPRFGAGQSSAALADVKARKGDA